MTAMKLAFTSCMSTQVFPGQQAVWEQIAARQPDRLVLTGDSVYIDAMPHPVHPRDMAADDFAWHVHMLYRALVAQPQFSALVRAVPTDAIWDDHDFLWNESYAERAIDKLVYRGNVRTSRAMFNAFRRALDARAPESFPASWMAGELWNLDEPAPGYRFRDLGNGVALHLTDGRSQRRGRTLLGEAQRAQIAKAMGEMPPGTTHLLASGSLAIASKGEHWGAFDDYAWLLDLAARHDILVISGDIHENRFMPLRLDGGRMLFEATSSGAAIRRLVTLLSECQNHGWLEIDDESVAVSFFSFGEPSHIKPVRIDRRNWRLVS